jgi:hypothetical protein
MPRGAIHAGRKRQAVRDLHKFRRLPPLLRVMAIIGLLLPLATIVLLTPILVTAQATAAWPAAYTRVQAIAASLGMLGLCCTLVVASYRMRFRCSGRGPFRLDSWPHQLRTLLLLAALPLCVLAWAVLIPPTQPGFGNVFLIQMLAAGKLGGVSIWGLAAYQAGQGRQRD